MTTSPVEAAAGAPVEAAMVQASERSTIEDGLLAGLVGGGIVAFWFLLLDTVRGVPFWTPSLLGSVIFRGMSAEEMTSSSAEMVFAYTGVHALLFLVAGLAIAWMVSQFEENPQIGMVLLVLFLLFESMLFSFEAAVFPRLVGSIGAWAVATANLLSAIAMFWYLLRRRPDAWARLRSSQDD